jgi:hypothetical protein
MEHVPASSSPLASFWVVPSLADTELKVTNIEVAHVSVDAKNEMTRSESNAVTLRNHLQEMLVEADGKLAALKHETKLLEADREDMLASLKTLQGSAKKARTSESACTKSALDLV